MAPRSRPFARALAAILEFSCHLFVVLVLLLGFWFIEVVMHLLWGQTERLFLDKLPMRYVFDVADLTLLGVLLVYGIYAVVKEYTQDPD